MHCVLTPFYIWHPPWDQKVGHMIYIYIYISYEEVTLVHCVLTPFYIWHPPWDQKVGHMIYIIWIHNIQTQVH